MIFFDAYVLSESSLFVYPTKIMIKTCGGTTLLRAIPKLLEFASLVGLNPEVVVYSRKNFVKPDRQETVHHSFHSEVELLQSYCDNLGQAYSFGPITAEHWNLFVGDLSSKSSASPQASRFREGQQPPFQTTSSTAGSVTLEIMMHQLNMTTCRRFFGKKENRDIPEIGQLIPGSDIDHFHFEPCGYSMNGLYENSHSTIHVTPENEFSYASYETSLPMPSYRALISAVLDLFRPGVFTVSIFEHDSGRVREQLRFSEYQVKNHTSTEFEAGRTVNVWNFVSVPNAAERSQQQCTTKAQSTSSSSSSKFLR